MLVFCVWSLPRRLSCNKVVLWMHSNPQYWWPGSPILRIAMPPKHEKHKNVKARLYCMRVDVAVIIHRTQAYGQTSVWHPLCNSGHHPNESRGALKVDRVHTKSSRPLHNHIFVIALMSRKYKLAGRIQKARMRFLYQVYIFTCMS